MRRAFAAYQARTEKVDDIGSTFRFVSPDDVPANAGKLYGNLKYPGKIGFKAKVAALNSTQFGAILDNVAAIARRGGMAFVR
jgi:hypothetical protein